MNHSTLTPLSHQEPALKAVMDTVLDGLIIINDRGLIQDFNPAAERIFGYETHEVLGKNVHVLMGSPYHENHDGYLKNYLKTGEKKVIGYGREVEAKRKDGSIFPMELGVTEMEIDGQRLFVGTIRDITQKKNDEKEIQNYIQLLKRSNQELDDFAYIASHDLKEPLRGLTNNALFLQEDYADQVDEGGNRRLNRMQFLCKRMEKLINDLLYFSRLGRQDLAIQEVDLNEVIQEIDTLMQASLEEKHAKIVVPVPLPTIVCDKPRLTEVFRNLISNAIKYNDKESKVIEIGVTDQEGERVFYVKDNGQGIDEVFFQDIFRIFKRLNDEEDAEKGTGVGLTFVKKIIERHNGKIWVDSELGKGTTFFFTLNLETNKEKA